jgi:putative ABC transport system permease protein
LLRTPTFALTAVIALAIGIGANTAMFAVVNSVLLEPLDYTDPDRLFTVREIIPEFAAQYPVVGANARHFLEWQRSCTCFDGVAMADTGQWNLTDRGDAERVPAARVTAGFFAVLGVSARLGRTFVAGEEERDDRVAVLSDAFWRSRFGASPDVLGQSLELDGVAHVIVGVLRAEYRYRFPLKIGQTVQERVDVYKPWRLDEQRLDWVGSHNYPVVARLAPGKTEQEALAEFTALQAKIKTDHFAGEGGADLSLSGTLTPLKDEIVARGRLGILLLLSAVATVMLIGCFNLGSLMLIRTLSHGREIAIRVALGAARGRIFRGVLIESSLIAICGAALGVVLAFGLLDAFGSSAPSDLPRADEIRMEPRALVFAALVTIAAMLVFGLFPALRATRVLPNELLRGAGRALTNATGWARPRHWLVTAEIGLSTALLVVAGLLISSFVHLGAVERGYDAENVITAEVSLPAGRYPDHAARRRFYDVLVSRIQPQTGVIAAGVTAMLPLRGSAWTDIVTVEGDERPLDQRPLMDYRTVSPEYLAAIGTTLLAGRPISDSDYPRRVAVVSRSVAERLWPGEDAIGKRFRRALSTEPPFEIIGVANDVRAAGLDRPPAPILYVPLWERSPPIGSIAIRTTAAPLATAEMLRATIESIDPSVPVSRVIPMAGIERDATAQRRFQTLLVVVFAVGALLLAMVGIYGVVGYSTARRTNEIGLRMALGASATKVLAMILHEGLRPVIIGLGAGILSALVLGRLIASLLFAVTPTDPVVFAAVALTVALVGLLSCWLPARRAARLEPMDALRE